MIPPTKYTLFFLSIGDLLLKEISPYQSDVSPTFPLPSSPCLPPLNTLIWAFQKKMLSGSIPPSQNLFLPLNSPDSPLLPQSKIQMLLPSSPVPTQTVPTKIALSFKTGVSLTASGHFAQYLMVRPPSSLVLILSCRISGHAGHATVDYASQILPGQVKQRLEATPSRHPDRVAEVLTNAIVAFDDSIAQDFLRLVPDPETTAQMTDAQLTTMIHALESSPEHSASLKRCMHGTTALIALLDPLRQNLWVASLGDCQAGMFPLFLPTTPLCNPSLQALGQKDNLGKWSTSFLSAFHNGRNEVEVQRIQQEHPGETESVHNHRVLGAIAVTRGQLLSTPPRLFSLINCSSR